MKDKIKRFLIDKKELLVFIAVVVVVFATVITIASLALSDVPAVNDDPSINEPSKGDENPSGSQTPTNPTPTIVKFALPISGAYEVIRTFFDPALSDEELVSAVISNGSSFEESKGMSYAKADNSVFEVSAIYDGEVVSVEQDDLDGTTVTIQHSNDVVSVYYSLSDVVVQVKDKVTCGQKIALASTSMKDVEAGVHVHLEVKVNNTFVNPASVFGKELAEVAATK